MKEIPLTKGYVAVVDDEDYELVSVHRWRCQESTIRRGHQIIVRSVYARAEGKTEDGKCIFLHRLIMRPPSHLVVDHIDGDGLNNTRGNLRVVTQQVNSRNRRALPGVKEFVPVHQQSGPAPDANNYRIRFLSALNHGRGSRKLIDRILACAPNSVRWI